MLYIIYPRDPSTDFLLTIYRNLVEKFGQEIVKIHYVEANVESYQEIKIIIQNIPVGSHLLFMGHGQDDCLYGAEDAIFEKKPLIKRSELSVFKGKYLFLLSCFSFELLRTSLGHSGIINSIGFGSLPTEKIEVDSSKKLTSQGVNENVIHRFKSILIEIVSSSFIYFLQYNVQFSELSSYFLLLLNKKISEVILDDIESNDNRILSNLLFQMKKEMVYQ